MTEWVAGLRAKGIHAIVIHPDHDAVEFFNGLPVHAQREAAIFARLTDGHPVSLADPTAPAGLAVWLRGLIEFDELRAFWDSLPLNAFGGDARNGASHGGQRPGLLS